MADDNSTVYPEDSERTIFIPKPGGRGPGVKPPVSQTPPQPPPPPQNFSRYAEQPEIIPSGVNPLASAAFGLIALPARFGSMMSHHDVAGLRSQVLDEIRTFENRARMSGIDPDVSYTARYILCAFIDEAVLNTIWGSNSIWTSQSLLSSLHNETSGGETFFVILDKLLRDPNANTDLLELMFLCISLGFKGQYAVLDRGPEKLEELKNIVFEHIRRRRGDFQPELSPHWQSQSDQRNKLRNYVPLWVVVAVAAALLLAIFAGFTMVLDESTDPVIDALENIGKPPPTELTVDK